MSIPVKRVLPFACFIVFIIVIYVTGLHKLFDLNWLEKKHVQLGKCVARHPILSPLLFIGIYTLSVSLAIPDSSILTMLGGLVFPFPLAIAYAAISETLGALTLYLIFGSLCKLRTAKKKLPMIERLDQQINQYPALYMLFLRISHVLPYWTTNLIAAYFRIPTWKFIWTTFLGVIPLTYLFTEAGRSLSQKVKIDRHILFSDVFTTEVKIALFALGLLMVLPIFCKKWMDRRRR